VQVVHALLAQVAAPAAAAQQLRAAQASLHAEHQHVLQKQAMKVSTSTVHIHTPSQEAPAEGSWLAQGEQVLHGAVLITDVPVCMQPRNAQAHRCTPPC
jgi:hypothetical protein